MSDSLQPHGLQHARLPCPLLFYRVCSNSCPLSQWCHPTVLSSSILLLPSVFPRVRVFSSESALHIRWPKYWNFSFSISPSGEYSGLISFKVDWWFDLLAVQGTLKNLLQHHSSKTSILRCLAFFMVQLSHSYMTTRKTIALTLRTFVGKVMSLLFNMLSRFVIAYADLLHYSLLCKSMCSQILWLLKVCVSVSGTSNEWASSMGELWGGETNQVQRERKTVASIWTAGRESWRLAVVSIPNHLPLYLTEIS